jgi:hypothetical protein
MSITKEIYNDCITDIDSSSMSSRYDKDSDTIRISTDNGTYVLKCIEFIENEVID